MIYYAKSRPIETIQEHTGRLLALLSKLKELYPGMLDEKHWQMLYIACKYHDWGKRNVEFQNKIRAAIGEAPLLRQGESRSEIPHGFLSPAALPYEKLKETFSEEDIGILCAAIFHHHERNQESASDIRRYIREELSELCERENGHKPYTGYIKNAKRYREENSGECVRLCNDRDYIMMQGLLNRLDYAASAHLDEAEISPLDDGKTYSQKTVSMLAQYESMSPVQAYLDKHRLENTVVIAATGSGKTEAALIWGDGRKMFYTLPLKTAINSMFRRIRDGGIGFEPCAILHSDALGVYAADEEAKAAEDMENAHKGRSAIELYASARQLCSPLTVCTIDQLFTFVFRSRGSEMRMATLAYSAVVIDEIQSYSPDVIAALIVGVKTIARLGGKFLIMTATLPKLLLEKDMLGGLVGSVPPPFHTRLTKRHRVKLVKDASSFDYEEIARQGGEKRVLVVCNTVGRAQKTYERLVETCGDGVRLLHSAFIRKDRKRLEEEIMRFAPNRADRPRQAGIWVATQVVEASLDVDFDVLFTDMCAIESLLQRMGRVYRGREPKHDEPNVIVYDMRSGVGSDSVILPQIYDLSLDALEKYDGMMLEESDELDMKQELMDHVYDPKKMPCIKEGDYYKEINKRVRQLTDIIPHLQDMKDEKYKLRDIDSKVFVPEKVYDELCACGKVAEWKRIIKECGERGDREERARIQDEICDYTLSLSYYKNLPYYTQDADKFYPGSGITLVHCEYDEKRGFIRQTKKEYERNDESNIL